MILSKNINVTVDCLASEPQIQKLGGLSDERTREKVALQTTTLHVSSHRYSYFCDKTKLTVEFINIIYLLYLIIIKKSIKEKDFLSINMID